MSEKKKAPKKPRDGYKQELIDTPSAIRSMFMDSGAHGLYNRHAKMSGVDGYNLRSSPELLAKRYAFYTTKDFYAYCDQYAAYLKSHAEGIDLYVNVDAIFHPELSYKALKYLENEHGLKPIPVLHYNTPLHWIARHLEEGYKFIGLGGLGQDATQDDYIRWADKVYNLLCDQPSRKPLVQTHGFAMTSVHLMRRYPWWSVDSASWVKAAAYGRIFVPHVRGGEFVFDFKSKDDKPYVMMVSNETNWEKYSKGHFRSRPAEERRVMGQWLEYLGVPVGTSNKEGEMVEWGVTSHWGARAKVNLLFFEEFNKHLPEWPWAFTRQPKKTLFDT